MKTYRLRSIPERIVTVQKAVKNVIETSELLAAMSKKKYNVAALNAGGALANTAEGSVRNSKRLMGVQTKSTAFVVEVQDVLRSDCVEFSQICRSVFIDQPEALSPLGLNRAVPLARADLIMAANLMFDNNSYAQEVKNELIANEWTDQRLSVARGRVEELKSALAAQGRAVSAAQRAGEQQVTAMELMDKWMAKFLKIARIVFADDQQQLEQLGVPGRSTLTKQQRAARTAKKQLKLKLKVSKAA